MIVLCDSVVVMRALVKAKLRLDDICRDAKVLFDTGSSYTVMSSKRFAKLFGEKFYKLPRAKKMKLINGSDIIADKYAFLDIIIGKYCFETIFVHISDDIPEIIESRKTSFISQYWWLLTHDDKH